MSCNNIYGNFNINPGICQGKTINFVQNLEFCNRIHNFMYY